MSSLRALTSRVGLKLIAPWTCSSLINKNMMANPRCFSLASIQFNQNQARDDGGEEKRAYESVYTYTHDNEMHMSRMYPKPERWPQYNDVVHNPEDGPVERVSF